MVSIIISGNFLHGKIRIESKLIHIFLSLFFFIYLILFLSMFWAIYLMGISFYQHLVCLFLYFFSNGAGSEVWGLGLGVRGLRYGGSIKRCGRGV